MEIKCQAEVDELLKGAVDLHVHASPDGFKKRLLNAFEAAKDADEGGMAALAIKNHDYCTAPLTQLAQERVNKVRVIGGVVLNHSVGGINAYAVEAACRLGAKIVWLPTFSAESDAARVPFKKWLKLIDEQGNLIESMIEVLEVALKHKMIVATGHISFAEIDKVVEAAADMGLERIVINHPVRSEGPALTLAQQEYLAAKKGVYLEYCVYHHVKPKDSIGMDKLFAAINKVGPKNCIISSDLGQTECPRPVDGYKYIIDQLLLNGFSQQVIKEMVSHNPLSLLS